MPVQVGEHIEDDDGQWISVRRDEDELYLCDDADALTISADAIPALAVALLKRCDPEDVRDMAMEMGFDLSLLDRRPVRASRRGVPWLIGSRVLTCSTPKRWPLRHGLSWRR